MELTTWAFRVTIEDGPEGCLANRSEEIMMKERVLVMILVTTLPHQVSAYEEGTASSMKVCMTFELDPILIAILVGSTALYYWHLYGIMQRNKSKSGSYWRG